MAIQAARNLRNGTDWKRWICLTRAVCGDTQHRMAPPYCDRVALLFMTPTLSSDAHSQR